MNQNMHLFKLDGYWWESKIGLSEIIKHDLFEIEGGKYGYIIQMYEKI